MDVVMFVFRKPGTDRGVYLVREEGKAGLALLPDRDGSPLAEALRGVPDPSYDFDEDEPEETMPEEDRSFCSLEADALRAAGGTFVTPPVWEEIRPNICFRPEDDVQTREVNLRRAERLTCDYWVRQDGAWGLLDEEGGMLRLPSFGDVVIANNACSDAITYKIKADSCTDFDVQAVSGRVLVERDGRWGMLRGRGDPVLPVEYESIEIIAYYMAADHVYVVRKDGRCGVVEQDGTFRIPMAYRSLSCSRGLEYLWGCTVFREDGEAGVGYVRLRDGRCLVEPVWDAVEPHTLYLAPDNEPGNHFFLVKKDGRWGLVYSDQGLRIPPVWDEIVPQRVVFQDPASYSVRRGALWGCCGADGRLLFEPAWDEVDILIDGIACVRKGSCWGAVRADGQVCIPAEWEDVEPFSVTAAALLAAARSNFGRLTGLVPNRALLRSKNSDPPLPDWLAGMLADDVPENLFWVRRDGLWGLVDTDGHVVKPPCLEEVPTSFSRHFRR